MISKFLYNNEIYKKLIDGKKVSIKNSSTDFDLSVALIDYENSDKNIFLILPNLYEAQKAYDKLCNILSDDLVLFFPQDELVASEVLNVSGDFKYERINTIYSFVKNSKKYIVVMNIHAALKFELSKDKWLNSIFTLKEGMEIEPNELMNKLSSIGYKKTYTVTKTCQYSRRGEIIDIYPLNSTNPIRIDFFDAEIETIKEFDTDTQKSIREIKSIEIIPGEELFYSTDELDIALNKINSFKEKNELSLEESNKFDKDILDLTLNTNLENLTRYIDFFDQNKTNIIEYCEARKVYLIDSSANITSYNNMQSSLRDYCDSIGGYTLFNMNYFMNIETLDKCIDFKSYHLEEPNESLYDPHISSVPSYKGIEADIVKDINSLYKNNIVICPIRNELRLERLKDIFLNSSITYQVVKDINNIKKGIVNIIYGEAYFSLSIDNKNINIINEESLFENKYVLRKAKYKSTYNNTTKISHYNELKEGDYVVHFDYGIGVYKGLKTMESNGLKRDYLEITYNEDTLYVPLEQISRIEKYNAVEDNVKITSLRSGQWEKAKEKVRKKVRDISQDLIKLYASRNASVGFACEKDDRYQAEFENKFMYELTPDQAKAIEAVKADMESERVMDRLVCGDVGYGKTEVALRAAFKAVMNSKQVALLCPTTILSKQHYNTFKLRMEEFGVTVELLNRFVPTKKQKEIIENIKEGKVDVVIGTHKLLSKDIVYKDLGLLIIDEEQRFGVTHKEKIKQLKVNVDTITLSATPIPRTLQMSIAGIKDLSTIETPPKNRYPVQTYVLKRNEAIIRDAILRELARGGQVFYMYNFVDTIYDIASKIQALVPEARVCVGHGRLEKEELEDVINDFIDKKYDVLVCTTIIETGIDIPDCNTLIVHDANRLGLSQLYQLRGRVGRSDRIAYAYMMYDPKITLNDTAVKRLETIKEFNELGSGYKIALRDLGIRGAGDILGSEQSGFITSIGLETYLEILNEEIDKIKNPNKPVEEKKIFKSFSDRTISEDYISNDDARIEIHKKIDKIRTLKDIEALSSELEDRFGKFDDSIKYYMYEKLFHKLLVKSGIDKVIDNDSNITLTYSKEATLKLDGNKMFEEANNLNKNIKLSYNDYKISISLDKASLDKPKDYLIVLDKYLSKIL